MQPCRTQKNSPVHCRVTDKQTTGIAHSTCFIEELLGLMHVDTVSLPIYAVSWMQWDEATRRGVLLAVLQRQKELLDAVMDIALEVHK